jgi:hypothetical protein
MPPSSNKPYRPPPSASGKAQATVKVVTQYVDRVRVVREKGETIIKEVPVYVPVQADAACTINRGFVRLHDAAAAGELPEPARDADAAAAGIALSAVAGTVAANYQTCHENAEQLRALQTWVREMKVASRAVVLRTSSWIVSANKHGHVVPG